MRTLQAACLCWLSWTWENVRYPWPPATLQFLAQLLSSHYRSPVDWETESQLMLQETSGPCFLLPNRYPACFVLITPPSVHVRNKGFLEPPFPPLPLKVVFILSIGRLTDSREDFASLPETQELSSSLLQLFSLVISLSCWIVHVKKL